MFDKYFIHSFAYYCFSLATLKAGFWFKRIISLMIASSLPSRWLSSSNYLGLYLDFSVIHCSSPGSKSLLNSPSYLQIILLVGSQKPSPMSYVHSGIFFGPLISLHISVLPSGLSDLSYSVQNLLSYMVQQSHSLSLNLRSSQKKYSPSISLPQSHLATQRPYSYNEVSKTKTVILNTYPIWIDQSSFTMELTLVKLTFIHNSIWELKLAFALLPSIFMWAFVP